MSPLQIIQKGLHRYARAGKNGAPREFRDRDESRGILAGNSTRLISPHQPGGMGNAPRFRLGYAFTTAVKSDHCSMRKARMSRTDLGNHTRPRNAWMARNRFAMSSFSVT